MPDAPIPFGHAARRARWREEVRARLATLRLSPEREAEIIDELSDHLEDHWREAIAGGAPDDEAIRLTLAQFRSDNLLGCYIAPLRQANVRPAPAPGAATTGHLLADVWQDLRHAARLVSRQPGFALAAVLTLALGVGANSAIFTVVHAVLLETLPFRDADRLYRVRMVYPDGRAATTLSPPDFMSVRADTRVFDRVEAYTAGAVTMTGAGEPREVRVASVSDGLFALLGIQAAHGRAFLAEEHGQGRRGAVILDHGFWQRAFGGAQDAIGRGVTIGGGAYTVVGVLAPGARLPADVPGARVPSEADAYFPLEYGETFSAATATGRSSRYLGVLARAREGVSAAMIEDDLRRLGSALQAAFPESNDGLTMNAITAQELIVGDVRTPLFILLGAVGFVLLVACANVASLTLARASARQEELAVRLALGAARGRLVRQLLTESVVLGLMGGVVGLALAYAGTHALVAAEPADIPRLDEIGLNVSVVLLTFAIALLASLAFGALPALQATGHVARGLHAAGRGGGADRRAQRARAGLVVAETALAIVLLTGAGLLLRSLAALTDVAPGFVAGDAMAVRIALFGRGYDLDTVRARVARIEEDLRALPGVTAAAATSLLPLSGPGQRLWFEVEGAPPPPRDVNPEIGFASVGPDYFRTIGAQLVRGRDFTSRDRADAPPVAIVNEAAIRRWFPNGNPIGMRVHVRGSREIVGVVADLLQGDPKQPPAPQLFVPFEQSPARAVWLVVRASGNPLALAAPVRGTFRRLDPDLAVSEATPLDRLRAGSVARPRFYTALLALFAAVALALAATGIFSVMSCAVAERTREIGIRMALGAQAFDVVRMIVGRSLALAVAGAGIGITMALWAGRVLQNLLFGVEPFDPPTLGAVVLILLASAAAAGYLPARRAARLDPASTLRSG
jgi:predicted permease